MDKELQTRLKQWRVESPPPHLAGIIVSRAVRMPQRGRLWRKCEAFLTAAFSDWQTGLAYKLASLVLCALLGFSTGWQSQEISVDIAVVAFGLDEGDTL